MGPDRVKELAELLTAVRLDEALHMLGDHDADEARWFRMRELARKFGVPRELLDEVVPPGCCDRDLSWKRPT